MEQISLMSLRGKVTIVVAFIALIAMIFTFTYISLANEEEEVSQNVIVQENNEINTIEEVVNEVENVVENIPANEQIVEEVNNTTTEKTVTYKGKKVTVPKVEKAAVNDKEDAEKKSSTAGTAQKTTVEEAKSMYEQVGNSVGIDVSKWNGNINWSQVKAAGIDFAMIRVGYRGSTVGEIKEDPYFQANIKGAISNGVKVGVYFFSMARTEEEAIQEAAWVVSAIRKYSITYPVAYDLESWGQGRISDVSYSQLTSNAIAFLGYIKSSGYTPMIYASKNDFNNRWQTSRFSGCKFWLAHYTDKTDYSGSYQMWQYSSKGSVSGISGYVDMNIAYFSYSNTAAPQHTCTFNFEKTEKEATCKEKGIAIYRCACGDSEKREIELAEHSYGDWEIKQVPTENEEGIEIRICEVCKVEEERTIEDEADLGNTNTNTNSNTNTNTNTNVNENTNTTEHICKYEFDSTEKEANCEENGSHIYKCSCGKTENKIIDKLGHKYGTWTTEKEPTETETGLEVRTCEVCQKREEKVLDKKPTANVENIATNL